MTAAGEWLPRTPGDDRAPLVPGVIARQLVDASEAYARRLADLWREALPDADCATAAQSEPDAHGAEVAFTAVNPPA